MWVLRGRCRARGHCSCLLAGNERHSEMMQKATASSTCLLWSQWPGPMASEAEPSPGAPQGRKASTWRSTRVLKEALVLSGGREGRCPQLPLLFLSPKGSVTPPPPPILPQPVPHPLQPPCINSTPGRWLQILQGPLSIPLAESHIPEQHMFHLKPRKVCPSKWSQREELGSGCTFLGRGGGGEGPRGRSKLFVLRILQGKAKLGPRSGTHLHAQLKTPPGTHLGGEGVSRGAACRPPPVASHAAHLVLQPPGLTSTPLPEPESPPELRLHSPGRRLISLPLNKSLDLISPYVHLSSFQAWERERDGRRPSREE